MSTRPTSASRKHAETKLLGEVLRSFVLGYKSWLEDALRREKLTLPQLRLLRAVEEAGDQSAASIARACQVTPQTLQAMLGRAAREGWIVRKPSPRNGSILTSTLTARGRAALQVGQQLSDDFQQQLWTGTSVAALRQCAQTLLRGAASMEKIRSAEARSDAALPSKTVKPPRQGRTRTQT